MNISRGLQRLYHALQNYLYPEIPYTSCFLFKQSYYLLLLVNVLFWAPDLDIWFIEGGVITETFLQKIRSFHSFSVFQLVGQSNLAVYCCYLALVLCALLSLYSFYTKVWMLGSFLLLISLMNLNPVIWDGEDRLFVLFGAYLLLIPQSHFRRTSNSSLAPEQSSAIGLRFIQLQMVLLYISTAWAKCTGTMWLDGTALYYVSRTGDLFGRIALPELLLENLFLLQLSSWLVLIIEAALGPLLLIPHTRRIALWLGVALHVGIEMTMNLFLFQWLMLLGLLSFLSPKQAETLLGLPLQVLTKLLRLAPIKLR